MPYATTSRSKFMPTYVYIYFCFTHVLSCREHHVKIQVGIVVVCLPILFPLYNTPFPPGSFALCLVFKNYGPPPPSHLFDWSSQPVWLQKSSQSFFSPAAPQTPLASVSLDRSIQTNEGPLQSKSLADSWSRKTVGRAAGEEKLSGGPWEPQESERLPKTIGGATDASQRGAGGHWRLRETQINPGWLCRRDRESHQG